MVVSLTKRSHRRLAPSFTLEFTELRPCAPQLGLQATSLSSSLTIAQGGSSCCLVIHLPVGYLAEVSLTSMMEEVAMVQAGEDGAGHGERVGEELVKEVEECQHWIEVEEAALTKRWKLIRLIPFL